jgi:hypothetical protein
LRCGLTGEHAGGDGGALDGFGVARSGSLHNQLVAQKSAGVHMAAIAPSLRAPPRPSLAPGPRNPRVTCSAPAEVSCFRIVRRGAPAAADGPRHGSAQPPRPALARAPARQTTHPLAAAEPRARRPRPPQARRAAAEGHGTGQCSVCSAAALALARGRHLAAAALRARRRRPPADSARAVGRAEAPHRCCQLRRRHELLLSHSNVLFGCSSRQRHIANGEEVNSDI